MPEIKHHFRAGKMNQDLDERLIPNGEYRDALNIEIASSQGDDVGSVQTIPGNDRMTTLGIAGAECIGSYVDHESDKIYWFIRGNTVDAIVEYDPKKNSASPVLVDAPATPADAVLNFSQYWYICGINIIDGLLFWTTGDTEPKMININMMKSGSTDFATTTTVVNHISGASGNFSEKDVTVIKKGPGKAPVLVMSNTKRTGVIESTFTVMGAPILNNSFTTTDGFGDVIPVPTTTAPFIITILGNNNMDWRVGDKLKVTLAGGLGENQVVLNITQTFVTSPANFRCTIDSISELIEGGQQVWDISLIQEKPMFEFKFPKFALRYKFRDGQYSPIGPFSEVAFLPDSFDYQAKKGYNLGMKNNLRLLKIQGFRTTGLNDVVEIDILYKESNHNSIYTVKSIKCEENKHDLEFTNDELEIESDVIHAVVPSNQLLRPYDNVPRKARAQEITGNRLVYGNYTHQYNLTDSNGAEITPKFEVSIAHDNNITLVAREPSKSIKTLRTYQVGVVYRDTYGRETPVLTDPTGSFTLDKASAINYNVLQVKILSNKPYWATSYKYFIKEPSNEYYNLAMDRHYEAEDGNAWISFPSSERNKVSEDKFLILKKEHNSDVFVDAEARYKVLSVSNEAPAFLREENVTQGIISPDNNGDLFLSHGYPSVSRGHVTIPDEIWEEQFGSADPTVTTSQIALHSKSDLRLRVFNGARETATYDVANIQYKTTAPGNFASGNSATGNAYYKIEIEGIFKEEDSQWLGSIINNTTETGLSIEFYQKQDKKKPEFTGRFFAKLNKDSTLETSILSQANDEEYKILQSVKMWQQYNTQRDIDYWQDTEKHSSGGRASGWFIDRVKKARFRDGGGNGLNRTNYSNSNGGNNWPGLGVKAGQSTIELAYHWFAPKDGQGWDSRWFEFETTHKPQFEEMVKAFQTPGALVRFTDDPDQTVYTIMAYRRNHFQAYSHKNGKFGSSRIISWTLRLDKPIAWAPEDQTGTLNGTNYDRFGAGNGTEQSTNGYLNSLGYYPGDYKTPIEILEQFSDDDGSIRSKNPAIFETEPLEDTDLDLYFESSNAYNGSLHGTQQQIPYSNCFSFGNGVESNRIRDDFNAVTIDKGVKASTVLAEKYKQEIKTNGLIFSGIYNATSSSNSLNQFIMAEAITKDIDTSYGSIQKLHARDTNLITLCEDKCLKILADKDALFNADGSANMIAANRFLGQATPFVGEYGISKNPESFSSYGYQAYFTDKNRGAVIRLSMDGITPISDHGMSDYFRDKLSGAEFYDYVIGTYNEVNNLYNVTIKNSGATHIPLQDFGDTTISFSEKVKGWTSRKSFSPESGVSLNNQYYTIKGGDLWKHGSTTRYSTFYDAPGNVVESMIKFIFNDMPSTVKTFKTINYEGTQAYWEDNQDDNQYYNYQEKFGWYNHLVTTDLQDGKARDFKYKENKWFSDLNGLSTDIKNIDTEEFAVQGIGQGTVTSDSGGYNSTFTLTINENND